VNVHRVVSLLCRTGAAAVTIHGRTMEQRWVLGQVHSRAIKKGGSDNKRQDHTAEVGVLRQVLSKTSGKEW